METEVFGDVFDALADTPAEAANMKVRADLLAALIAQVKSWEVPQEGAAKRLAITRLRLNDLLRGKLGKFSLDALVNLAAAAGLTLEIRIGEAAWHPAAGGAGAGLLGAGSRRQDATVEPARRAHALTGNISQLECRFAIHCGRWNGPPSGDAPITAGLVIALRPHGLQPSGPLTGRSLVLLGRLALRCRSPCREARAVP